MQKHKKNTERYEALPMLDSSTPELFMTGLTPSLNGHHKDGSGAWTSFTPTSSPTEIGSTGVYEFTLSAAEMNHDRVIVKMTASGAADTLVTYDMTTKLWDDLNDFNASSDTVASVTTVATCTTNTDMRGTDGANTVAPDNAGIAANGTAISNLNDFNPSLDIVANVMTVNTCTNNSDMRGTDNALLAASAPTNWSIMLINGSGEITTSNPASGGGSAHTAEDVRDLILAGDKTPIAVTTGSVNNVVLVDTTTANTDMRGTDGALLAANTPANFDIMSINGSGQVDATGSGGSAPSEADIYTYFTSVGREDAFKADTSGLSTFDSTTDQVVASNMRGTDGANTVTPNNAGIAANGVAIAALNDPTAAEIVSAWGVETPAGYPAGSWGYFLDAQVSSAGAGGSGLYQVTVTVQDNALNALQGARINVDGTTLTLVTDSSGQCVFNLDSGVYTLECSPPAGYDTPVGQVVTVVASDASATFTLSETNPGGGDCDVPWIG